MGILDTTVRYFPFFLVFLVLFSPSLHFYISGMSIYHLRCLFPTEFPLNCLICESNIVFILKSISWCLSSSLKEGGVEEVCGLMKTDFEYSSSYLNFILSEVCEVSRGDFIYIYYCSNIEWGSLYYRNSLMEINQPDRGIFNGLGHQHKVTFTNRKPFPSIRNRHHFEYSHHHPNQYRTIFSTFHRNLETHHYSHKKSKNTPNSSQICLGTHQPNFNLTQSKSVFTQHNLNATAKLLKPKEEGLGINEHERRTGEKVKYSTTAQEAFILRKNEGKYNSMYKQGRGSRYNPITGEKKREIGYGYQEYVGGRDKNYKANNMKKAIRSGEYDIINGRKLTCV